MQQKVLDSGIPINYSSFISDEIKRRNDIFGGTQSSISTIGQSISSIATVNQSMIKNSSANQSLTNISFCNLKKDNIINANSCNEKINLTFKNNKLGISNNDELIEILKSYIISLERQNHYLNQLVPDEMKNKHDKLQAANNLCCWSCWIVHDILDIHWLDCICCAGNCGYHCHSTIPPVTG